MRLTRKQSTKYVYASICPGRESNSDFLYVKPCTKCNINESPNKLRASKSKTAQERSQKVVGKK